MIVFIVLIVLDMSNRLENYRLSRHVHVVSSDVPFSSPYN